jgi:hypothetical protein
MARTIILCLVVAVASFTAIIYFRLTPIWETAFRSNRVMIAIPILLLSIFFAAVLVAVANRREMGRNVSGWFDVIALMVAEGILAYLILGSLLSTSLVILICCAFVVYLHFAQRE